MTFSEIKKLFDVELPEYFKGHFDAFIAEYNKNDPLITNESIDRIQKQTGLPDECMAVMRDVRDAFLSDADKHAAICFWRYVTVYTRKPWQNYIYTDELLKVDGFEYRTCNMLMCAMALDYTLTFRKPPEDLNRENVGSFGGYTRQCHEMRGYWGINEFHWNLLGSGGCMFMQGALKFCPSYFSNDFTVLKKGDEYISLVAGEHYVGAKGELLSSPDSSVCRTVFERTDGYIKANRISKDGIVSDTAEIFDLAECEIFLEGDSHTMDIHIPSKMQYTVEVIRDAFLKALDFYGKYMPEHKTKAIVGYSWIFAPQLKTVLPEGSNILAVNDWLNILPTTGTYDHTLSFIRQGSSLAERMAQKESEGVKFHFAVMYKPLDRI